MAQQIEQQTTNWHIWNLVLTVVISLVIAVLVNILLPQIAYQWNIGGHREQNMNISLVKLDSDINRAEEKCRGPEFLGLDQIIDKIKISRGRIADFLVPGQLDLDAAVKEFQEVNVHVKESRQSGCLEMRVPVPEIPVI